MKSQTAIAKKDQTTAFVVAIPTPFAPSFAPIPQAQLINDIAKPKLKDFKMHTFKSFKLKPNQTESK